jgi:digeranylgeranylglycerophospholipid reductase
MVLGNLDIDPETVKLWVGREVAPGGYLWLFPKGPGCANVGLGIMGKYAAKKKAIQYLKEFVDRNFPNAAILSIVAGGVPTSPQLKSIIADGLMLAGDAGHQIDPLSGGGIINALIGGKLAGETAAEAIKAGDVRVKFLKRYQSAWDKVRKKDLQLAYKIKKIVYHFEDDDLNHIADVVLALPLEKRTNFAIFKAALKKHPGLILDMAKVWIK